MDAIFGNSLLVFLVLTLVMFGGAGFMMGQAVANTWRPVWQVVPYGILLALFERFLAWSLLDADFGNLLGLAISALVIVGLAYLAWRLTLSHKMVTQYPWMYERAGPFAWRERH